MMKMRTLALFAAAATMGAGCRSMPGHHAAGTYVGIDPSDAAASVVLHVRNVSNSPMEIRTMEQGRSLYVGSVAPSDSSYILLDRTLFPTASLYLIGIPADGGGRATAGPLAASKGSRIDFVIQPAYAKSYAIVVP